MNPEPEHPEREHSEGMPFQTTDGPLTGPKAQSVSFEELRLQGPISEEEALAWTRALTSCAAQLHREGRVDGRLHGARILGVFDPEVPEIRECRIEPASEGETEDPAAIACLAPEQIAGGEPDAASDIYALGVVLYGLVTGCLPFVIGDGDGKIAQGSGAWRLVRANPILPSRRTPGLGERWDRVLLRAMELDPLDRFASASDLDAALHGRPVIPGRRQLVEQRERARRRRRRRGLVAALLAMSALAFYVWRSLPSSTPAAIVESTAAAEDRRSLAVLGFANQSSAADSWISTALSEMLAAEVSASEAVRVVSGEHVARMKLELGVTALDTVEAGRVPSIRDHLDADVLIFGSYRMEDADGDRRVLLDLRLLDTRSKGIGSKGVGSESAGSERPAEIRVSDSTRVSRLDALVGRLGVRLRSELGLHEENASASASLMASQPQGDAARLYAEGLDRLRLFDALGARDRLREAAEIQPSSPQIRLALADALSILGNDAEAAASAEKAHELALSLPREQRLFIEGRFREISRNWPRAIEIYEMLWQFYPDDLGHGLRLASAQTAAGDLAALSTIDRLLDVAAEDPRVALAESAAAELDSDYARKRRAALRAATAGERLGARLLIAEARVLQSFAAWNLGDMGEAVDAVDQAYRLYSEAGDPRGTAYALNRKAIWLYETGSLDASVEAFEQALAISREIGSADQIGSALNNVSLPIIDRGDLKTAAAHLEEAALVCRERGSRLYEAIAWQNLAEVRSLQGDFESAKEIYDRAFVLLNELGYRRILAYALAGRGEALRLQGNFEAARAALEEGLEIARELGHDSYTARALFRLGDLEADVEDFPQARRSHEEALRLRTDLGEEGRVAQSRTALARLDRIDGETARAADHLEAAAAVFARQGRRDDEIRALALIVEMGNAGEERLERLRTLQGSSENPSVRRIAKAALETSD